MSSLLDLAKSASACVKCGKCIPHCTIYMANRDEATSPRGFLDLLGAYQRGDLELDSNARHIFESCFLCTTCVTHCPSSLPIDTAIESVRVDIAKKYGIAWYKKAYFFLLRHRRFADMVFRFCYFIMPCAFKQEHGRFVSRFRLFRGLDSTRAKRSIFPIGRRSFLQTYQGEIAPACGGLAALESRQDSKGERADFKACKDSKSLKARDSKSPKECENLKDSKDSKDSCAQDLHTLESANPLAPALTHNRVAIFIGCLSNYNYINVGESLLAILSRLGIRAFVPHLQECCGAPAFFTGDVKSVLFLAKKNIAYFESFWDSIDAMIIPEATCAAMIKRDWIHALHSDEAEGAEYIARLKRLLPKIEMASEWLYRHTRLLDLLPDSHKGVGVTYHDPCHARKVLGIYKEPRALLGKSFRLVEMSDSSRCCGFGGISMQSSRYELTLKAGAPKAEMIDESGAEIVSAECGACRMQIDNALTQRESQVRFAHPLELIAQSLEARDTGGGA